MHTFFESPPSLKRVEEKSRKKCAEKLKVRLRGWCLGRGLISHNNRRSQNRD